MDEEIERHLDAIEDPVHREQIRELMELLSRLSMPKLAAATSLIREAVLSPMPRGVLAQRMDKLLATPEDDLPDEFLNRTPRRS